MNLLCEMIINGEPLLSGMDSSSTRDHSATVVSLSTNLATYSQRDYIVPLATVTNVLRPFSSSMAARDLQSALQQKLTPSPSQFQQGLNVEDFECA